MFHLKSVTYSLSDEKQFNRWLERMIEETLRECMQLDSKDMYLLRQVKHESGSAYYHPFMRGDESDSEPETEAREDARLES